LAQSAPVFRIEQNRIKVLAGFTALNLPPKASSRSLVNGGFLGGRMSSQQPGFRRGGPTVLRGTLEAWQWQLERRLPGRPRVIGSVRRFRGTGGTGAPPVTLAMRRVNREAHASLDCLSTAEFRAGGFDR
jgi:hypothetical protein